jgi:nucleotide-binding universal stress UspA family protein
MRSTARVVDGGQGQADFPANVRDLLGDLSQQGLNAILKAVDFVGPQPAQGIADIAAEANADVIVVATRGHSAIGGLLVGSVTQQLLHMAPCPVLAVPPPLARAGDARHRVSAPRAGD